ncbi:MAG: response regulator [Chloroflexota bacterium]
MNSSPAPGRLLVIDDNQVMRLLLRRGLEQLGHSVTSAENGRQGLDLLRAQRFDLVLLDIEMPEMDGYQALQQITADPALREIPVVMVSSLEEVDGVARCIQLGAEDYLLKPPNPVLLQARVSSSLEKKRLRDRQRELIRKLASGKVADDLLARGFSLGGQLLQASVLFVDIRSFTTLAEALPPTATIELLKAYYRQMFAAINRHGGVVNQILGDGILALFGAPAPLERAAARAVLSGLEMIERIEVFDRQQARLGQVQLRIGVGIASGPVIAGYTGTLRRATYTCLGETVDRAAWLESATKTARFRILIDAATHSRLDGEPAEYQLGRKVGVLLPDPPDRQECAA